jgi:hypothetical protein
LAATTNMVSNLRAPAGRWIIYLPDLNPDLNSQRVPLNKLDGTTGGGFLLPPPIRGTVIMVR